MIGANLIKEERARQIQDEHYTPEHDDLHEEGELIEAAVAYSVAAHDQVLGIKIPDGPPGTWPWEDESWKRSGDPVRNLVKAGALIAAEIDRIKRKEASL